MKIIKFDNKEQWLKARNGKITGTRLKEIVVKRGTTMKLGYYELIAERLAVDESEFDGYVPNETPMDRGTRLQKYAVDRFSKETGKKVNEELVLWVRDDNESIAISPDGTIVGSEDTEALETKCLSSSRHLEAYLTDSIPDEYEYQKLQYFITNDKLEKLYFAFYDPRIPAKDFFYFTIERKDVLAEIDQYLKYQVDILKNVDEVVSKLLNF